MHFAFQNTQNYTFFPEKNMIKKNYVCLYTFTLPEIFRPVTQNTLICLFGLVNPQKQNYIKSTIMIPNWQVTLKFHIFYIYLNSPPRFLSRYPVKHVFSLSGSSDQI